MNEDALVIQNGMLKTVDMKSTHVTAVGCE